MVSVPNKLQIIYKGPVPLFVIPETGSGTFNKDDFVVKVMAVDHQTKSTDPGYFYILSSFILKANFSEDSLRDTQVVIAYPQENAHAYVKFCFQDFSLQGAPFYSFRCICKRICETFSCLLYHSRF